MDGTRAQVLTRVENRIRALPCWNGNIEITALKGGLSNESYLVRDADGSHVARFGQDYPFHHVYRDRELMTARAAYEAGFAPEIRYAEQGVMVSAFLKAKTYGPADVTQARHRIALMLRRFHKEMAYHVRGAGFIFWVFHVIRDYARTLDAGGSRMIRHLPSYLALSAELEGVQAPLPVIFGHNDLLPGNILDDGTRLWLIDYEYAGFNTAMFDLAGAASNAGMSPEEADEFIAAYFGHAPGAEVLRAYEAMKCASLLREAMWSMVSELHLSAPDADYETYTNENLGRLDKALDQYRTRYGKTPS